MSRGISTMARVMMRRYVLTLAGQVWSSWTGVELEVTSEPFYPSIIAVYN